MNVPERQRRRICKRAYLLYMVLSCTITNAADKQLIDSCINRAIAAYASIQSYTCLFDKKELVNGRYIEQNNILLKFMKPSCVYMKWTEGPAKGFETLYCSNKYDGKLIVLPNGIWSFLTLAIDPKGPRARKNNRHTIREAGIGFIIETMCFNYRKAKNDTACTFLTLPDTIIQNAAFHHIRTMFPENRGYYGTRSDLYFSVITALPEKIMIYGRDDALVEGYYFHELHINPGLTEKDFQTTNKEYGFHGPIVNY